MKRRIEFTLNEAQLSRLIKKMVREAEEEMEDDMPIIKKRRNKFDIEGAAKEVSRLFAKTTAKDLDKDEIEDLTRMARKLDVAEIIDNLKDSQNDELDTKEEKASEKIEDMLGELSESYLFEGKFDRIKSILSRVAIFGGLSLLGTGGLAFVSQIPGHVDFDFLDRVYDIVQSFGCSRYCGPYSFYIAVLGVLMYFKGRATKDAIEDIDENYYY